MGIIGDTPTYPVVDSAPTMAAAGTSHTPNERRGGSPGRVCVAPSRHTSSRRAHPDENACCGYPRTQHSATHGSRDKTNPAFFFPHTAHLHSPPYHPAANFFFFFFFSLRSCPPGNSLRPRRLVPLVLTSSSTLANACSRPRLSSSPINSGQLQHDGHP